MKSKGPVLQLPIDKILKENGVAHLQRLMHWAQLQVSHNLSAENNTAKKN